jgi:hypothetical protein
MPLMPTQQVPIVAAVVGGMFTVVVVVTWPDWSLVAYGMVFAFFSFLSYQVLLDLEVLLHAEDGDPREDSSWRRPEPHKMVRPGTIDVAWFRQRHSHFCASGSPRLRRVSNSKS